MAYFKSNKVETRIANILKGTSEPASSIGDNGQLYLKYIDIADTYSLREYIEVGNTAGPYINTGLTTSSNDAKLTTEAEVIYSYTDRPDHNTWMFGAFSGYGIILGYQNGQTEGYVGSGGKLLDYDTNVHTVAFKDGGLYADDALKQTGNWTQIPNNTPIYIFGRGGDNRVIKNTRIYRCKIWQNGVLLRDLIPVQRKSDDEIGMLDLVNNVFYDNDGTGSFTCGGTSDISSPIFKSYAKINGQWQNLIGTNIDDILAGGSKYIKTTGSFTSASSGGQKVEVNCGFKPDLVMVDMEFGNGFTRATYLSTAWYEETDHPASVWDLRPMENVIYAIVPGSVSGETGITDLTDTGFKYRSNGSNTTNKACTYTAIKFDAEEAPEPDTSNLLFKDGKFYNTDKVELGIANGVVSDGAILFTPNGSVGGIYFNSSTIRDKFVMVVHYENDNQSVQVTMQYGTSKVGTSVVDVVGYGTDRYTFETKTINVGASDVIMVSKATDGDDTIGVFLGNHLSNATWRIYEIYLIPY